MLRLRSNWSVIEVEPSTLVDVICVTPGICPNCRSSGAATVEAIVSELAPGSWADTCTVGKSTWGSGATGSSGKDAIPTSASAPMSKDVAIGRRMNGSEMLTGLDPSHTVGPSNRRHQLAQTCSRRGRRPAGDTDL